MPPGYPGPPSPFLVPVRCTSCPTEPCATSLEPGNEGHYTYHSLGRLPSALHGPLHNSTLRPVLTPGLRPVITSPVHFLQLDILAAFSTIIHPAISSPSIIFALLPSSCRILPFIRRPGPLHDPSATCRLSKCLDRALGFTLLVRPVIAQRRTQTSRPRIPRLISSFARSSLVPQTACPDDFAISRIVTTPR